MEPREPSRSTVVLSQCYLARPCITRSKRYHLCLASYATTAIQQIRRNLPRHVCHNLGQTSYSFPLHPVLDHGLANPHLRLVRTHVRITTLFYSHFLDPPDLTELHLFFFNSLQPYHLYNRSATSTVLLHLPACFLFVNVCFCVRSLR